MEPQRGLRRPLIRIPPPGAGGLGARDGAGRREIRRPFGFAALLLLAIVVVGVLGYVFIEGWSVVDALWMVVITLTSIGYGEVHPLSATGRVFTMLLIAAGLSVGTYTMTQLTRSLLEGDLGRYFKERRRKRMMADLSDHYIVIGYGRLGRIVARELQATGHRVAVIEREGARGLDDSEFPFILGDGSNDEVLRQAGIERARGLAVTAAPAAEAIFITLSGRQLNPSIPILTRVESDEGATKARRAGATAVVSPHSMGGWRMAHGLVRPYTTTFLDLATLAEHQDIMLEEIEVGARSGWSGCSLKELGMRQQHGVLVVALRRANGEMVVTPDASTRIGIGDFLICIGAPDRVRALAKAVSAV